MTSVRSFTAGSRAAQPCAAARASASAASCWATRAGILGGGLVVRVGAEAPPHPASNSTLDATSQTLRQRIRQPPFANLLLGALERVGNAVKRGPRTAVVEQEPGRARIAVPRLADRARVEYEPRVRAQLRLRPLGSEPAGHRAVHGGERPGGAGGGGRRPPGAARAAPSAPPPPPP